MENPEGLFMPIPGIGKDSTREIGVGLPSKRAEYA
jgi:hypothetical protein